MKALFKVVITLALIFASTFLLLNQLGWLTLDAVERTLNWANQQHQLLLMLLVVGLLFADLFIAVPTLTICILAGHFLGATLGFAAASAGMLAAGFCGYVLSRCYGSVLVIRLCGLEQWQQLSACYQQHGTSMILLSRAAPILPEVSACIAGVSHMPLGKFALLWLLNCVPYAAIASYAGSISTLQQPQPAIYAMVGLSGGLMLAWGIVKRQQQSRVSS